MTTSAEIQEYLRRYFVESQREREERELVWRQYQAQWLQTQWMSTGDMTTSLKSLFPPEDPNMRLPPGF